MTATPFSYSIQYIRSVIMGPTRTNVLVTTLSQTGQRTGQKSARESDHDRQSRGRRKKAPTHQRVHQVIDRPTRRGDGLGGNGLSIIAYTVAGGLNKAWSQRILVDGKERTFGLGKWPQITPPLPGNSLSRTLASETTARTSENRNTI